MKTILVPTDFSSNANNALDYAIAFAKKEKAKIILLHTFHITYMINPDIPQQLVAEQVFATEEMANSKLKLLCEKVEHKGKVKCEFLNKQGLTVDMILSTAEEIKPDIVIMGTRGASGIKEIILGSTTADVIEKVKCPVIAVPEQASFHQIKNITYATDYHTNDIEAIKKLVDISKLFNPYITVLHVSDKALTHKSEEEKLEELKEKVNHKIKYDKIFYKLVYGQDLVKVLTKHIKGESPDMLVMSMHSRNLFDKLFGTSFTKKVAYHTRIPLMAFHSKQEAKASN
jgi:nucleotide-binding universal stress UspA family protein